MLRSLLLSRNDGTIRIVARCFRDLEVELEHCSETRTAVQKAAEARYDAFVVDDAIEDARLLLEKVLELSSCKKSVRIALAEPSAKMDLIFKTGTQIILYKPLSTDRVRHGLRAVRNLMAQERRRGSQRVPTTIPASVSPRQSRGSMWQVLIADLSESGAAISLKKGQLPPSATFDIDFALPGNSDRLHATAEVAWQNNQGGAGLHFVDMSSYARKQLANWLRVTSSGKPAATRASHAGS